MCPDHEPPQYTRYRAGRRLFPRRDGEDRLELPAPDAGPTAGWLKRIASNQPPMFNVDAHLDLTFVFGIDPNGAFYVDSPGIVARLHVDSGLNLVGRGSVDLDPRAPAVVEHLRQRANAVVRMGAETRLPFDHDLVGRVLLHKLVPTRAHPPPGGVGRGPVRE